MLPTPSLPELAQKFPAINQALRSQGLDVGGCNVGGCVGSSPCQDVQQLPSTPEQKAAACACNLYATSVTFGFQLAADCDGNLYRRVCAPGSGGGPPTAALDLVGDQLTIDFEQNGYLCIYGINASLLDGTEVVIDSLQNASDLSRFNSTSLTIYETTGCWCPFEACIISGQTPLILKARSVPKPGDGPSTPDDPTGTPLASNFYASFTLNFLGVSIRSISGACQVAPVVSPFVK